MITFSDMNCKQHTDQPCYLFCKTCKQLVCFQCVQNIHNGHNLVDDEEYRVNRVKIRYRKTRIEKTLNHLTKMKDKISTVKKFEHSKYEQSKREIFAQKKIIEKLVEELLNELDESWKKINKDFEINQNKIARMEKKLLEQNTLVDKLMMSEDFVYFFDEIDRLDELIGNYDVQIHTKHSSMQTFVPVKLTRDNIGTLMITTAEHETEKELRIVRQYTSDLKNIHFTEACCDGSLWISDNVSELLQYNQIKDNNIQELLRLTTEVYGMAVTPTDDLLIINGEPTLKYVSRMGEVRDSKYSVAPLVSISVHMTSNTVIIGAMTPGPAFPVTGRRAIILVDLKGSFLVKYELDSYKRALFTYPVRISSTCEGNICVVDRSNSDGVGRVVVIRSTGDVINTYSGHTDINNITPFRPSGIITTTFNNIVVLDRDTHTIHLLDSEGHFIIYYSTIDLGIIYPFSVAVSKTGDLFIGCASQQGSPDTFKSTLYEVELLGC